MLLKKKKKLNKWMPYIMSKYDVNIVEFIDVKIVLFFFLIFADNMIQRND